jgi:hypothetical protein
MSLQPALEPMSGLTHLQRLEAESIQILREVVAEAQRPVSSIANLVEKKLHRMTAEQAADFIIQKLIP